MLAKRVGEGTQQWKEEGSQPGLDVECTLLLRQARKRFGEVCAQAPAPLLELQDNPGDLAALREWFVTGDTYVFPLSALAPPLSGATRRSSP